MASMYSKHRYDELAAEEEQLVTKKDDHTPGLAQARPSKTTKLISQVLQLALIFSLGINVYLGIRTLTTRHMPHQMFCESHARLLVYRL